MIQKLDIAVRYERNGWVARNVGQQPTYASVDWSSNLGDGDLEDIIDSLFRNANVIILPAAPDA